MTFRRIAPVLSLLVLAPCAALAAETARATIDRLGWLAGCWAASDEGGTTEEHWMRPLGGTMLGTGRTVRNGRTVAHEFMRVEERDGRLVFISKPSGQAEASFVSQEITDSSIVFSNPAHDFPQRVLYRRQSDGSLAARIEGEEKGKVKGVDFPMKRVPCDR